MNATLLHAVVRLADARTSDADLLDRFIRNRDERAFEELVRRHGPLVWSICRHLLPHHADAEDAFQAVFLALARSARLIRSGQALPAWLHGVSVRVAAKTKRSAARRRQREQRAAVPEADRSVPDAAWSALMTAVHEEVQQLPDAERTAFVLCDLEGVRQPDAAARLGWPLGTLSGRLCKARQRLLEQLTRRGIAPGVLAIGGIAGSAGVVPAALVQKVTSFPVAMTGVSSTVAELARGLVEGVTMRTKVLVATLLVAGALGATGGALVLSKADAQSSSGGSAAPATGAFQTGTAAGQPGKGGPPAGGPGVTVFQPGAPGVGVATGKAPPGGGGMMSWTSGPAQLEFKFVDIKNDRKEFEKVITQNGKEGWEFCGSERFGSQTGAELVLVFKKSKGGSFPFSGGGFGGGGFGGEGGFGNFGGGGKGVFEVPGLGGAGGGGGGGGGKGGPGGAGFGVFGGGNAPFDTLSFKLKHTAAADVASAIEKAHAGAKLLKIVAEPTSNTIIIISDPATIKTIQKMIEELDAKPKPAPTGPGGGNRGPMGGGLGGTGLLGGGGLGGPGGMPPAGGGAAKSVTITLTVVPLKFASAKQIVDVLMQVFPGTDITGDPRTNQLIIRADEKVMLELGKLIQQLDVETPKK